MKHFQLAIPHWDIKPTKSGGIVSCIGLAAVAYVRSYLHFLLLEETALSFFGQSYQLCSEYSQSLQQYSVTCKKYLVNGSTNGI